MALEWPTFLHNKKKSTPFLQLNLKTLKIVLKAQYNKSRKQKVGEVDSMSWHC